MPSITFTFEDLTIEQFADQLEAYLAALRTTIEAKTPAPPSIPRLEVSKPVEKRKIGRPATPRKCKDCGEILSSISALREHRRKKHPLQPVKCPECGQEVHPKGLGPHIRLKHRRKTIKITANTQNEHITSITAPTSRVPNTSNANTTESITVAVPAGKVPSISEQLAQANTDLYVDCECGAKVFRSMLDMHLMSTSHRRMLEEITR